MTGGFLVDARRSRFVLKGISQTRQSLTVAVGDDGARRGLGRPRPRARASCSASSPANDGRLAVFTVLLAVFASDTVAYFAGRLVGRHRMAPTISPGKTWEGLVAGTVVAVLVPFFALYQLATS